MKKLLIGTAAIFCLLATNTGVEAQNKKKDKHAIWIETPPATATFNWEGTFKGTLPCADCEGVLTVTTLNKDNTFRSSVTRIIGESRQQISIEGNFLWKKEGNYIALINPLIPSDTTFALLSKDRMTILNSKGQRYSGANAANYIMLRVDKGITDKYLQLIELNNKPVDPVKAGGKEAFIMLHPENTSFNGNGSCNSIMGTYELGTNDKVTFSGIITTMMACPTMDIEEALRLALESTDHFVIKGDVMILENAMKQAQARFKIIYLK